MAKRHTTILVIGTIGLLLFMHSAVLWPSATTPRLGENRVLAAAPGVPTNISEARVFRTAFDSYVADNFPARPYLIAGLSYARYLMGYSAAEKVRVGTNGWLFYDDGQQSARNGVRTLGAEQAQLWIDAFVSRTQELQARGITYVVLVPPLKEAVYPEYAPGGTRADPRLKDGATLERLARAAGHRNLVVLAPHLQAARARQPPLYTPYDTHWTGHGAYIGYTELLRALSEQGQAMRAQPLSQHEMRRRPSQDQPQDLAMMLGISSLVKQDIPWFSANPTPPPSVQYLTPRTDWTGDRVMDTGSAGRPVLVVTGDSFSNELLPFLYPHFSRIVFAHNGNSHFRSDLIDKYSPDVVLLEVHEPQLRLAMSVVASDLAMRKTQPVRVRTAVSELSACTLDSLSVWANEEGQPIIEGRGWIADANGRRSAPTATVFLQSTSATYQALIDVNIDRADVAAHFKTPALKRTGFYLIGNAAHIEPGTYSLLFLQDYEGQSLMCVSNRTVEIPAVVRQASGDVSSN